MTMALVRVLARLFGWLNSMVVVESPLSLAGEVD
jgi:hypothetical protein